MALIAKNRQQQLRNEQLTKTKLEQEKQEVVLRNKRLKEEEIEAVMSKKRYQDSLLDELMSTDRPADEIVAEAKAAKRMKEEEDSDTAAQSMFSKPQFKEQKGTVAFELAPMDTGDLFCYQELVFETFGPSVPVMEDLQGYGYLEHVRALDPQYLAGGFTPAHACHRALQEAFSCLTLSLQQDR